MTCDGRAANCETAVADASWLDHRRDRPRYLPRRSIGARVGFDLLPFDPNRVYAQLGGRGGHCRRVMWAADR